MCVECLHKKFVYMYKNWVYVHMKAVPWMPAFICTYRDLYSVPVQHCTAGMSVSFHVTLVPAPLALSWSQGPAHVEQQNTRSATQCAFILTQGKCESLVDCIFANRTISLVWISWKILCDICIYCPCVNGLLYCIINNESQCFI